jgi:hypothetical protein
MLLLLGVSSIYSEEVLEDEPHSLILSGSPISPYGKLEYSYQFSSAFVMKTGVAFGSVGIRVDAFLPYPYSGTTFRNETLIATPLVFSFPLYNSKNPISLSFGGLIVFKPIEFRKTDEVGPRFNVAFSFGGDWRYYIPDTNLFVLLESLAYFHLGEYPSHRKISPWFGAGIGYIF